MQIEAEKKFAEICPVSLCSSIVMKATSLFESLSCPLPEKKNQYYCHLRRCCRDQNRLYVHQSMPYLYRVLKPYPFEDPSNGLVADNPYATYTVVEHVAKGDLKTQFISTCKTYIAAMEFAEKGKPMAMQMQTTGKRKIVSIDILKLIQLAPDCIFYDLTHPAILNQFIPPLLNGSNDFARYCANKFAEELLQIPIIKQLPSLDCKTNVLVPHPDLSGRIPPECLTVIGCV